MKKRVIAADVILFGLISSGWARDTRYLNLSMVHRGDGVLVPGRVNRPDNSLEARLHAAGKVAAGFPWTHGDDPELYRRLWELGFDCFGTDYPEVMNRVIAELKSR